MKALRAFPVLFLALFLFAFSSNARAINPGDHVQLKATNPEGVPLHRESRSSMFARLPDGAVVEVVQTTSSNWIKVSSDNLTGWIVKKYVEKVVATPAGGGPVSPGGSVSAETYWDAWQSDSLCSALISQGKRLPRPSSGVIRLVTWNIRWFPQGTLSGNNQDKFTDQPWLSCVLAWLDADVIAVEEILTYPEARKALENVIDGLQGFNGGDWRIDLQQCGSGHSQHVGFIYNADRVELSGARDMWQFNGASSGVGDPCGGRLRPGRYAYVKSKIGGFDFHIIVVHTDSGKKDSDLKNRNRVLDSLDTTAATLLAVDRDIIVLGDFNTMGTDDETAQEELQEFATKVSTGSPGFRDIPPEPECSEYYGGHGGWLDHIVVTKGTQELGQPIARVQGYCSLANCERLSDMPPAYNRLSDHCPVVIDFIDQDLD